MATWLYVMRNTRLGIFGFVVLVCGVVIAAIACGARSLLPFTGEGILLNFGAKETIVSYQLVLLDVSTQSASEHQFTFSGAPTNEYWLAIVLDGADLEKCWSIHHMSDKGLHIELQVKDDDSEFPVVAPVPLTNWRASFSPNPKSYALVPPTRRCVLYADGNPHFKLVNDHKYTVTLTLRRLELVTLLPIRVVLEGRGSSGEL